MLKNKLTLLLMLLSIARVAQADLTALTVSAGTVSACQDYFTSEWAEPLDMDTPTSKNVHGGDILRNLVPRETNDLGSYSYSGGIFTTTTSGTNPYFYLLTWNDPGAIADYRTTRFGKNHIINPTTSGYNLLTFRMYTDVASDYQVYWDKSDGFAITDPVTTYTGWHTYQLDLSTASINTSTGSSPSWSSGSVTGIRIDPSRNNVGATIKVDWAQLTLGSGSCPTFTVNYTAAASDRVTLYIDDDTDPTNGYQHRSSPLSGGSGSTTINTSLLFPGTYHVYGVATPDYASSYGSPWDMDSGQTDVDLNRVYNITLGSNNGFTGGKFCGTVSASDSNFYMKLPDNTTIDTSLFNQFSMELELTTTSNAICPSANYIALTFFNTSGGLMGQTTISTNGSNTYTKDMSGVAGWSGNVGSFRINPAQCSTGGVLSFCVDNIKLASTTAFTLSTPTPYDASPSTMTIGPRRIVKFIQPDDEGGEDYAAVERGKPWAMDATSDFEKFYNVTSASIHPGNSYTDSGGNVKIGDYMEATSKAGSDDPENFSIHRSTPRIDPTKYKVTCFTLDVDEPTTSYHSVARVLWEHDGLPVNGDDIVIRTTGEARYCVRMDTMQLDGGTTPSPHPWSLNADSSLIDYFRIDPLEESFATTYRFADIRLAADHKASSQFAVVIDGDRDHAVSVYYNTSNTTSGGTLVGTLGANRNTDVLLWDTSGVSAGTYYLYATVDSNSFLANGPVVVDTSYSDSTAPILSVDAPITGHKFTSSLEFAGYAIDNVRLAAVEVFIDNIFQERLKVDGFNKQYHDTYIAYPYSSSSLFNENLDTSSVALGDHTLRLDAYDTAGNKTTHTATITKVADSSQVTSPISYTIPNLTPTPIELNLATPAKPKISAKASKDTVTLKLTLDSCSSMVLKAGTGKNKTATLIASKGTTLATKSGIASTTLTATIKKVVAPTPSLKDKIIYLLATCDDTNVSKVTKFDTSKIVSKKKGSLAAIVKKLKTASFN